MKWWCLLLIPICLAIAGWLWISALTGHRMLPPFLNGLMSALLVGIVVFIPHFGKNSNGQR